jgi:hypothetical protein
MEMDIEHVNMYLDMEVNKDMDTNYHNDMDTNDYMDMDRDIDIHVPKRVAD